MMHEPGQSGRSSLGAGVVVVVVVVVVVGRRRGRLSQHTDPRVHVDVCGTITLGRSQKADMRCMMQKPGHRGRGECVVVVVGLLVVVVVVGDDVGDDAGAPGLV